MTQFLCDLSQNFTAITDREHIFVNDNRTWSSNNNDCHNTIKYTMVTQLRQSQSFIYAMCIEGEDHSTAFHHRCHLASDDMKG